MTRKHLNCSFSSWTWRVTWRVTYTQTNVLTDVLLSNLSHTSWGTQCERCRTGNHRCGSWWVVYFANFIDSIARSQIPRNLRMVCQTNASGSHKGFIMKHNVVWGGLGSVDRLRESFKSMVAQLVCVRTKCRICCNVFV